MNITQQIQSLEDELEKNEQVISNLTMELNNLKKNGQKIKKIIKALEEIQEEQ